MPPQKTPLPPTAKPNHGKVFDPWNSSAAGHQRPDMRPGLGWRDSRNKKLMSQFAAGHSGGERQSDTYGAGSEDFDENMGMVVPKAVRARANLSVRDMLVRPGSMKEALDANRAAASSNSQSKDKSTQPAQSSTQGETQDGDPPTSTRHLFDGVVVYINGSTAPLVSDHKIRRILADNGAKISLHLGRRQVTHVIVGKPASGSLGSGGGLAGGKLEKEIKKIGGCSVKFVGTEW
ncbi:BRCA1 C terminus domain-containing protein [Plectosphaerella plurivora]|uniref:BRCA1 C terminus domain-containing protein n=1 Tax=Plectosphaerella plurivora TaxID=936078 RepID=A0A9P9AFZ7_9PEZI|nr:BRCA1 C terminus domain-containing protein [Plectosphaerella plurivora]